MSKTPGQFAEWLREELAQRGYAERGGPTRFAKDAGLHLSIVSRVLNEGRVPEIEALRSMGRVLGYTLGKMMIAAGVATPDEMPPGEPPPRAPVTGDEAVSTLQEEAQAREQTIAELLLEHGIDARELVLPDSAPYDPEIAELEEMGARLGFSRKVIDQMIIMNLENRARRYREAHERREAEERRHQSQGIKE